jgi:hypothetical protein
MNLPIVVDSKKIYDPSKLRDIGFTYKGVGAVNYY